MHVKSAIYAKLADMMTDIDDISVRANVKGK